MLQILERFFGASPNVRCGELLITLAEIAVECADRVKASGASDLNQVVDFEHKADKVVRDIHELLDAAFILRFEEADVTELIGEIDDIVDGLKKVATHVALYAPRFQKLSPHAEELLAIALDMVKGVESLVRILVSKKVKMADLAKAVFDIGEQESRADAVFVEAERELVASQGEKPLTLDVTAHSDMLGLLEDVTDHAHHSARLILSMARKEA